MLFSRKLPVRGYIWQIEERNRKFKYRSRASIFTYVRLVFSENENIKTDKYKRPTHCPFFFTRFVKHV